MEECIRKRKSRPLIGTIFRNIYELETPYYSDVKAVFDRIKTGNSKELILQIRKQKEKKNTSAGRSKQYLLL